MSWLKIDDGFAAHPKIAQLSDREFRTWMRLLCYAARYKIESGDVATALNEVVGVTEKFIERCVALKLVDVLESGEKVIHDWSKYQPKDPTAAERQQKRRDSNVTPSVTDQTVTNAVTVTGPSEGECVTPDVTPLSRERASRPVPSFNESSIEDSAEVAPAPPPESNGSEHKALRDAIVTGYPEDAQLTKRGWARVGAAAKELAALGASPDEVLRRVEAYRRDWPLMTFSPQGLSDNWPVLGELADKHDGISNEPYPEWVYGVPVSLGCVVTEFPASKVWKDKPGWWDEDVESGVLDSETLRFRLGRRP